MSCYFNAFSDSEKANRRLNRRTQTTTAALIALASLTLVASAQDNLKPAADAGSPQSVRIGQPVHLSGSRSTSPRNLPLTYRWNLVSTPSGSAAALSTASDVAQDFMPDRDGEYVAQVIVSDGVAASDPAQVVFSTRYATPVAVAGADMKASVGKTITLNGGRSWSTSPASLKFHWKFDSRPTGSAAVLADANTAFPSFTPDVPGDYVAHATVACSSALDKTRFTDGVTVTISTEMARPHAEPKAEPLDDRNFVLNGSGSTEPNGLQLRYAWTLLSAPAGSASSIGHPDSPVALLKADVAGTYVAQLTVSNGSQVDRRTVEFGGNARTPRQAVNAGPDQHVNAGSLVQLNAMASGSGSAVDQSWWFTVVPEGSRAVLNQSNSSAPSFTVDLPGDYVVEYAASGPDGASASTVMISTGLVPPVPVVSIPSSAAPDSSILLHSDESRDAAGQTLDFAWSLLSSPDGSASIEGPGMRSAVLRKHNAGSSIVQLKASNGRFDALTTASQQQEGLAVSPNTGVQGTTLTVTLTPGGPQGPFTNVAMPTFGTGITVEKFDIVSGSVAAIITIDDNAPLVASDVTVQQSGWDPLTKVAGFTVTAGTRQILSVSPATSGQNVTDLSVTIIGEMTHFKAGHTTVNFGSGVTVSSVTIADDHTLTAVINVGSTATPGTRNVTVTTETEIVTLNSGFQVLSAPSCTLSYDTYEPGAETDVLVTGTNTHFSSSTTVTVNTTDVQITLKVMSPTSLWAHVVVSDRVQQLNLYGMTFHTGEEAVRQTFSLVPPLTISQLSIEQGAWATVTLSVSGGFGDYLSGVTFGQGIVDPLSSASPARDKNSATIYISANSNAGVGPRNVVVRVDGNYYASTGRFSVTPGSPKIISISASSILPGQTLTGVEIAAQMIDTSLINSFNFGSGITVTRTSTPDHHHIVVSLTAAPDVTPGPRSISMTDGTTTVSAADLFKVVMKPLILSVPVVEASRTIALDVTGYMTHFSGNTSAAFSSDVDIQSLKVMSPELVSLTIVVKAAALPGLRTLTVTTGTEVVQGTFTIAVPLVLTPDTGLQGTLQHQTVLIDPNYLAIYPRNGPPLQIPSAGDIKDLSFGPNMTVDLSTLKSALITMTVDIIPGANAAAIGAHSVSFDSQGVDYMITNGLSVLAATPQVSTISPNLLSRQTQVTITVAMIDFGVRNPTVTLGPGATVSSVKVIDNNHLSFVATVTNPGGYDLTISEGSLSITAKGGITVR